MLYFFTSGILIYIVRGDTLKKVIYILFIFFISIPCVYGDVINIKGTNAILYNMNEDTILYDLKSDEERNIASLTKIMTTIVAIENNDNLDKEVVVSKEVFNGISEYSKMGLKVGDVLTIRDLLYGVMLPSGADAVNALMLETSGNIDEFIKLMNDKVNELGLKHTKFDNGIGGDSENNYSTAKDMAAILKYALKNEDFKVIFGSREYVIKSLNKKLTSTIITYSKSYGLDTTDITGSKSGFTDEAGVCLASTATIDDVNYLLVVLNSSTDSKSNAIRDSLSIYDYYSSMYSYQKVISKNQKFNKVKVKWGHVSDYTISSLDDISLYLRNDTRKARFEYKYDGISEINYKIKKGDKLGSISVIYEGDILAKYDVYLNDDIEYYHPVLYTMIFVFSIFTILSFEALIKAKKRKKKKNRK